MVDGRRLTFDLLGLKKGVFTMRDRETGTIWQHLDGQAVQGPLKGRRLRFLPLYQETWEAWRAEHPEGTVLSLDTPYRSQYRLARIGVLGQDEALYGDKRLPANTLVLGVEVAGSFWAYTLEHLSNAGGVLNTEVDGQEFVVAYDAVTAMASAFIGDPHGETLHFQGSTENGRLVLVETTTGERWSLEGRPLTSSGQQPLVPIPAIISEWYGWSAYHPDTGLSG